MSSFLTGSFKSSAAIDPADRLHRRDLTSRGLEGKPNHSAFNRCCLVAEGAAAARLLLRCPRRPKEKSRPTLSRLMTRLLVRGSSSLAGEGPSLPNRLSGLQVNGLSRLTTRASRRRLCGWPALARPRVLGHELALRRAAQKLAPALRHGHQPRVLLPLTGAISVTEMANCRTTPGRPAALLMVRHGRPNRAPLTGRRDFCHVAAPVVDV